MMSKTIEELRESIFGLLLGGLAGTIVLTAMMYLVAPMMLGKPMDIAAHLSTNMGVSWNVGMTMHFVLGTLVFPVGFVVAGSCVTNVPS